MGCAESKCLKSCIRALERARVRVSAKDLDKELYKASIKEVFNLFLIIDYLPLKDLVRIGQVSRYV